MAQDSPQDCLLGTGPTDRRLIHDIKNHISTLGLNLQLLEEDLHDPETPRERRSHQRVVKLNMKQIALMNSPMIFFDLSSKRN